MNKEIFKHILKDAWGIPINEIVIIDSEENNIKIKNKDDNDYMYYSIPKAEINTIKEKINQTISMYKNKIDNPPMLDGTIHEISLSLNDKELNLTCNNLGYFDDSTLNNVKYEFTKYIVWLINDIQNVLNTNNIEFDIYDENEK